MVLFIHISRDDTGIYNPGSTLAPATIGNDISGFGTASAAGKTWAAFGAPDSVSSDGLVIIYQRASNGVYDSKQCLGLVHTVKFT